MDYDMWKEYTECKEELEFHSKFANRMTEYLFEECSNMKEFCDVLGALNDEIDKMKFYEKRIDELAELLKDK